MNLLQKWILGKTILSHIEELKAISTTYNRYTNGTQMNYRYFVNNGRIVTAADNKVGYIQEGYNVNDIIYSVINMILDKCVLPEWGLYKVVDEEGLKKANRLLSIKDITNKQYKQALKLKYDSVEPLSSYNLQAGKLQELLRYPNETDSIQDHTRSLFGYKLLVGDYFEWWEMLKRGANQGMPNSLWSLPAQYMNIKVTDEFPIKPSAYELTIWNQQFDKDVILHEKYWNPNWDINGQQLYGFAPLRAFFRNTTRNNAAKDASTSKFRNGGLEELIFVDDNRLSPHEGLTQAQAIKHKLNSPEYRGPDAQGKFAVSGVKAGAVHLGNSPVELGIIDSEKWDAIMFCNGYGVPPELLGLTQKTYNNVKEAEKALTTRSAIPLLTSRRNSLNRFIQTYTAIKGQNIYVDYDTECFTELQTEMGEIVGSTSRMMMITPNEERELCNMEARPEPEADEPWVLSGAGRVPLADYQATPVDDTLNESLDATDSNDDGKVKPIRAADSGDGKKRVSNA